MYSYFAYYTVNDVSDVILNFTILAFYLFVGDFTSLTSIIVISLNLPFFCKIHQV